MEAALQDPIRLSTIVVSQDPRADALSQTNALKRSIVDRAQALLQRLQDYSNFFDRGDKNVIVRFVDNILLPSIFVVDNCFPRGKSASSASPQILVSKAKAELKERSVLWTLFKLAIIQW